MRIDTNKFTFSFNIIKSIDISLVKDILWLQATDSANISMEVCFPLVTIARLSSKIEVIVNHIAQLKHHA